MVGARVGRQRDGAGRLLRAAHQHRFGRTVCHSHESVALCRPVVRLALRDLPVVPLRFSSALRQRAALCRAHGGSRLCDVPVGDGAELFPHLPPHVPFPRHLSGECGSGEYRHPAVVHGHFADDEPDAGHRVRDSRAVLAPGPFRCTDILLHAAFPPPRRGGGPGGRRRDYAHVRCVHAFARGLPHVAALRSRDMGGGRHGEGERAGVACGRGRWRCRRAGKAGLQKHRHSPARTCQGCRAGLCLFHARHGRERPRRCFTSR